MGGVIRIVKDFFFVIFAALIGSIVLSLILMLAITSIYQSPLVTLIVTLLFTPFHFSDYQRFLKEREWLLIAVRFALMTALRSFLVGLFRYLFFAFFSPKNRG